MRYVPEAEIAGMFVFELGPDEVPPRMLTMLAEPRAMFHASVMREDDPRWHEPPPTIDLYLYRVSTPGQSRRFAEYARRP